MSAPDPLAQAIEFHRAGRLEDAAQGYRQVLSVDPSSADANHNLGAILVRLREYGTALQHLRAAVECRPETGQYWISYAYALILAGRNDEARQLLELGLGRGLAGVEVDALWSRATRTGDARQLFATAIEAHRTGQIETAVLVYEAIIALDPDHADALSNLGLAVRTLGRQDDAVELCRRAVAGKPDHAEAWNNLGVALIELGRAPEARDALHVATTIRPNFAEAHNNLGNALRALGDAATAEASFRRAVELKPAYGEAHSNLGATLRDLGRLEEAEASLRRAVEIAPNHADVLLNLSGVLVDRGQFADAEKFGQASVALRPDNPVAHLNLGAALVDLGRLEEAESSYRRAIALRPDYADAYVNLGNVLRLLGRFDESLAHFERALALEPRKESTHKSLLMALVYHPVLTPDAAYAMHRRFETLAAPAQETARPHSNDRNPERRLKIGYMSSDFRLHSVARYLMPLLSGHDRACFEIHLYAEQPRADDVTRDFQMLAAAWHPTLGVSDANVAEQIRRDGIDILVCVAGRFDRNRMLVLAHRPAPVQISICDAATSGLSSVDYLFSDRVLTPRRTPERFTERVLCLPTFHLSEVPPDLPDPKPRSGEIVFGSFNNPAKISDDVLDLWAATVAAVPGSRLELRFMNWYEAPSLRARVHAALDRAGLDRARVSFPPKSPTYGDHLAAYDGIDIALDTFPFSGSTTTFEALAMGVPVITLPGWRMMSRWSAAMLSAIDLSDLAATSRDDFVDIARRLAADRGRLAGLRVSLRGRLVNSAVCAGARKARQYERFYRTVWRRWCTGPEDRRRLAAECFAEAVARHRAGRTSEALAGYERVLKLWPDHVEALGNRGFALHAIGRSREAEASCRRALEIDPDNVPAHSNLGMILHAGARLDEAEIHLRRAIEVKPEHVEAQMNLGVVLKELGRLDEAEASFRHVLAIRSDEAEAYSNLGATLRARSRLTEAEAACRRAVELRPDYAEARSNLGVTLCDLGRHGEAEASCRRAIQLRPGYAEAYSNLGHALRSLRRLSEADSACRRAIELDPRCIEAHINLGSIAVDLGHIDAAEASFRRALELSPVNVAALRNLANVLRARGSIDDALACVDRAIAIEPQGVAGHLNRLATATYHPGIDPQQMFALHRQLETILARPLVAQALPHMNDRTPTRKLRVGYLSSDFYSHSAARTLLPLIGAHNRSSFEVHLYADVARPDAVTQEFRTQADFWHSTVGLDDRAVADMVRSHGIDILVCLAGRFDGNRPLVLAHRPAPVQISSHDVATSGMDAVDYLIADRVLVPRGTPERFSERVLSLPCFYLAGLPPELPAIHARPGPPVFGCFNNPAKISEPILDLWARLLARVPGSRLHLRYLNWYESASLRERIYDVFDRHGIERARIEFLPAAATHESHLEAYNGIDVALDTFPFSGSTTTLDSLTMGVPVVTLPGWSMVSRWSAMMLSGLGLTELVANTPESYLAIAGRVAADRVQLARWRETLRERFTRSSLCDGTRRARQYERLYRAVWRRWCADPGRPKSATASLAYAIEAHRDGRLAAAAHGYETVLKTEPDNVDALSNLGGVLFSFGRFKDAATFCRRAIALAPTHAAAHNNLGLILQVAGDLPQAIELYRRAIELGPGNAEAIYNLGRALFEAGDVDGAEAQLRAAIAIRTDHAEAYSILGDVRRKQGAPDEAIAHCRRALALDPHLASAHVNLGNALRETGDGDQAESCFRQALIHAPEDADALYNLGCLLQARGELAGAEPHLKRAVTARPSFALAHRALGDLSRDLDRLEESEAHYRSALSIAPDDPATHINLGNALQSAGRLDEAVASYERAVALAPESEIAHWNLGVCRLRQGDFARGLPEYEWRWKWADFPSPQRSFRQPLWSGGPEIAGRTVLLHAEQGLGDTIQFCRFAPLVAAQGARVVLAVPRELASLMSRLDGPHVINAFGETLPDFDFHCPLMSLPLALGTDLSTIPARVPYLRADRARVDALHARLGAAHKRRIGIVWSGSLTHPNDRHRSIALEKFTSILAQDAEFHSLQAHVRAGDAAYLAAQPQICSHSGDIVDFEGTAALLEAMDLVIAVDTSVAHLAGALGRPVWLLVPSNPDWRWMDRRTDSPWYPTATLFRQPKPHAWEPVLEEVARRLAAFVAQDEWSSA
jgi:protein O-GlcNAc transferase